MQLHIKLVLAKFLLIVQIGAATPMIPMIPRMIGGGLGAGKCSLRQVVRR
ncbi:hypothetical protein [Microcoleus sp. CAWBG58]|nr:hypothetical protein [Microcoleus sp. CAWBG58]